MREGEKRQRGSRKETGKEGEGENLTACRDRSPLTVKRRRQLSESRR